MKPFTSPSALAGHVALALVVVALTASCTSDEVIGYETGPDAAGPTPGLDAGGTPPKPTPDATVPRCGDGQLTAGEECDDGNAVSGDGCSIACKTEATTTLPEDACPGGEIVLTSAGTSRTGSVTGNNAALNPNYETTCGGGNGKDAIYKIVSDRPGRATARLTADFAGLLSLRGDCEPATVETTCEAAAAEGAPVEIVFPLAAGQTLFLAVDALAGGTGNYTLDVTVEDSSCGDGVAQLPEQCDDGNAVTGDGCNASCQLDDPPSAPGTCPGASYTLVGSAAGPVSVSFAGDTSLLANTSEEQNCNPSVTPSWSSGGRDQVYAITPTISGGLTTTLFPTYTRPSLHVRQECFSPSTELDCAVNINAEPVTVTIPVTANKTYFVFADTGFGTTNGQLSGGPYTLQATLTPQVCGNGTLETGEQCDDGAAVAGDGCAPDCQLEPSSPGIDTCPGATMAFVTGPDDVRTFTTFESTTRLNPDVYVACTIPSQTAPTDNPGQKQVKDAVYTFVAPYDGFVEADLDADYAASLDLRSVCADFTGPAPGTTNTLGCVSVAGAAAQGSAAVRGAVRAGLSYFLVVKGRSTNVNTNNGTYSLTARLTPAVCGNGRIEGAETCDDGPWPVGWNHESGCSAACTIEPTPATGISCATSDPIAVTETAPGVFTGTVRGGNWNRPQVSGTHPGCSTAGNQQNFVVTPPVSGVLVARTTSGTFPITLGARASCAAMNNAGSLGGACFGSVPEQQLTLAATAGVPIYLSVDGQTVNTAGKGRFELEVTVGPAACGDGVVAGAESCDDSNVVSGDGCSSTCALEASPASDTCPGRSVQLVETATGSYAATVTLGTGDAQANYAGDCGGPGRDRVLQLVAPITGTLSARLDGQRWGSVLYAREACSDGSTQIKCDAPEAASPNVFTRVITFDVVAGQPLFLFADGNAGQSGPATFQIVITP